MNTAPHSPNSATDPDAENKTSVRQLLDGQEYPVAKGDIINKGFDRKASVEKCVAYLNVISQLTGCPRYTGDIITLRTLLKKLSIDNNDMLGAAQFMVDSRGMHFNSKTSLYINFQKNASIFCKEILGKMMMEGTDNNMSFQQLCVLLQIMIF